MLGIVLLYVGAVLLVNGIGLLGKIDNKSTAMMNLLTGGLGLIINIISLTRATTTVEYYAVGTGLLFAFTYIYLFLTYWFDLDPGGLGWYCLFVAITAVPCSVMSYLSGDSKFTVIWLIWGALWFLFYLAMALKVPLGKFLAYATIAAGTLTAWIPGYLMLINKW